MCEQVGRESESPCGQICGQVPSAYFSVPADGYVCMLVIVGTIRESASGLYRRCLQGLLIGDAARHTTCNGSSVRKNSRDKGGIGVGRESTIGRERTCVRAGNI